MEYHQYPFWCAKLLLEEVENLIAIESGSNGNPWICVAKLTEVFYEKHGVSLEVVAKVHGDSDGLRSFLTSSRRF